jgi:hypothetical protein
MNKSRFRIFPVIALALLTMLACVVPGIPTASAPAPTADTVLLATMVAETVSAALEETASAVTPVPTNTPVPPPPTETPTAVPPSTGSSLFRQEDLTSRLVDERAGYELTVPAGWLAVRVNEQEYFDAWELAEAADPAIQNALREIESEDPNQFRLLALDTQDGHLQGGIVTNIRIVWNEQYEMSLENETDLLAASAVLQEGVPGIEVFVELTRTSAGVPIGRISSRWPPQIVDGVEIVAFQKQVYLDLKTGTLTITLSTTESLRDVVLPGFDAMIDAIILSG